MPEQYNYINNEADLNLIWLKSLLNNKFVKLGLTTLCEYALGKLTSTVFDQCNYGSSYSYPGHQKQTSNKVQMCRVIQRSDNECIELAKQILSFGRS